MLLIFRKKYDAEKFIHKLGELANDSDFISIYEVTFSEQSSQVDENMGDEVSLLSSIKYFVKYDQSFTVGKPFYFVNLEPFLLNNKSGIDSVIVLSIVLNMFSTQLDNSAVNNIFDMLGELWESSQSWGVCFDFINACLNSTSHGLLVLHKFKDATSTIDYLSCFPHHFLLECTDTESDFSLDGGLWSITLTSVICNTTTATAIVTAECNQDLATHSTMLGEVSAAVSGREHKVSGGEDEWEMVTHDLADLTMEIVEETGHESAVYAAPGGTTNGTKASYKDMILRPAAPMAVPEVDEMVTINVSQRQQPMWQPNYVVVKTPYIRADRVYGLQSSTNEYMDEDDGIWDLVDSQAMFKQGVAVNRHNKVTMLPPKIKEQKEKRILEKAAVAASV